MKICWIEPWFTRVGGLRHVVEFSNVWAKDGHEVFLFIDSKNKKPCWQFSGKILEQQEFNTIPFDAVICNWPEIYKKMFDCKSLMRVFYCMSYDHDYRKVVGVTMTEVLKNSGIFPVATSNYIVDKLLPDIGYRAPIISPAVDPAVFFPTNIHKHIDAIFHNQPGKRGDIIKKILTGGEVSSWVGFDNKEDARLRELYSSAITTVVASVSEGFGLIGLESMACGTPPVIMDNGGCQEYIKNGVNGFLVAREDWMGVLQRIRYLKSVVNTPVYKNLSLGAINTAARFRWETGARKMIELFKVTLQDMYKGYGI